MKTLTVEIKKGSELSGESVHEDFYAVCASDGREPKITLSLKEAESIKDAMLAAHANRQKRLSKTPVLRENLSFIEQLGLRAYFDEFYANFWGMDIRPSIQFFWCNGSLCSEDMANGTPIEFEGKKMCSIGINENGAAFIYCLEDDGEENYFKFDDDGTLTKIETN